MLDCNVLVRRKQNQRLVSAQSLASRIWGMVVIRTCRAKSGRIIAPMTQELRSANGVIAPPPLDHWIDAVLLLCVRLVQGVATTLGMIFNRNHRDWHTADACEDLPQAKSDIHFKKESNTTHGVILGLVPRISVGSSPGLSVAPDETNNRDSRHKAENDAAREAHSIVALMVSSARSARPSTWRAEAQRRGNHEGVLTLSQLQQKSSSGSTQGSFFSVGEAKQDSRVKPENDSVSVARARATHSA
jgi:hypothetical protein